MTSVAMDSRRGESADRSASSPGRRLLTVAEAAAVLGLGRSTTYQLVAAGELETVTIGRTRRVPVEAVDQFIARLRGQ